MNSLSQKKLLIIAESIDVEDSSGSKGRVALINNLNSIGYDLKVYHYTRKNISLEGVCCFSIKENRRSFLFYLSRTERYLRYYFKIELNKFLERIFGFSFTLLNDRNSIVKGLKGVEKWNPDLVLTLSKGGSFRPHHALLKLPEFHNRWLAYIHDPYPMHFYPKPYPWFEPGYRQKEEFMKNIAMRAAHTAFPSQFLMEWMGKHFKPFEEKGIVIPHQLEEKDEVSEELPQDFDLQKFNLVHAGNLLQGRDPNGLVLGFQKFLDENPMAKTDARLTFIGGANYYSKQLASYQKKIPQFHITFKPLPFREVQSIQRNSSVNIILEAKSAFSPFLPGKFPHCVDANRLILLLGPPKSESRRLLGEAYEYWAEIDDVKRISLLLASLYLRWKVDKESLRLGRPDLVRYLSKDHLKEVMPKVI